jgi:hypothetical protein
MREHEQPMTPLAAAKDLIRPYVVRGESIDSLASSSLGAVNGRYRAMIEHDRTISVVMVGGDGIERRVPLREVYAGVRAEMAPPVEEIQYEEPIVEEVPIHIPLEQAKLF